MLRINDTKKYEAKNIEYAVKDLKVMLKERNIELKIKQVPGPDPTVYIVEAPDKKYNSLGPRA
jgi:hypothetical protein